MKVSIEVLEAARRLHCLCELARRVVCLPRIHVAVIMRTNMRHEHANYARFYISRDEQALACGSSIFYRSIKVAIHLRARKRSFSHLDGLRGSKEKERKKEREREREGETNVPST